jgi:hypothetical protein
LLTTKGTYTGYLDRINHITIAAVFDNAMKLLWEGEVKQDNILLFVTDTTPYMVKAEKRLHVPKDGSPDVSYTCSTYTGHGNQRKLS